MSKDLWTPHGSTPSRRQLKFECEFQCIDCGSTLYLRTWRALVEGPGQIVICKGDQGRCKRPYRVRWNNVNARSNEDGSVAGDGIGATPLPRDAQLQEVAGFPPPMSSIGLLQPPHKIETVSLAPGVCYRCGVDLVNHQPEPEEFKR